MSSVQNGDVMTGFSCWTVVYCTICSEKKKLFEDKRIFEEDNGYHKVTYALISEASCKKKHFVCVLLEDFFLTMYFKLLV